MRSASWKMSRGIFGFAMCLVVASVAGRKHHSATPIQTTFLMDSICLLVSRIEPFGGRESARTLSTVSTLQLRSQTGAAPDGALLAGIAVVVVVVLGACGTAIYCVWKRNNSKGDEHNQKEPLSSAPPPRPCTKDRDDASDAALSSGTTHSHSDASGYNRAPDAARSAALATDLSVPKREVNGQQVFYFKWYPEPHAEDPLENCIFVVDWSGKPIARTKGALLTQTDSLVLLGPSEEEFAEIRMARDSVAKDSDDSLEIFNKSGDFCCSLVRDGQNKFVAIDKDQKTMYQIQGDLRTKEFQKNRKPVRIFDTHNRSLASIEKREEEQFGRMFAVHTCEADVSVDIGVMMAICLGLQELVIARQPRGSN